MRSSTIRNGVVALGAALLVVALAAAALPWIASTQIVRDRIASELSLWSGYRVSLGEAPILDVWPSFKATLNDVSFQEWSNGETVPVLDADRLEVSMSALAALRGDVVLSGVEMYRPLLRLTRWGSVIDLPASPGGGRMIHAVDIARRVVSENPASPDTSAMPTDAFGTVEFFDGRIAVVQGSSQRDILTGLTGKIAWPSLDGQATLSATGIWRGESINVEATSAEPLVLLAGGNGPIKASLKSAPLAASFDGIANLSENSFFDGSATVSSPSLRRALEWSDTEIAPGAAIGSVALEGKLTGSAQRLKLDTVKIDIGGNVGAGVLEASFTEAMPSISGTLDFDKLDLRSFLTAFVPAASGDGNIHDAIDAGISKQINLDLRLSAASAALGPIALTEVAATTQVKGDLSAFDISDSTAFGGTMQAGIRIDRVNANKSVEMRLLASEVDAGAFAQASGITRFVPQGRANLSVILKGSGNDWNTVLGNAEGSVNASMGAGSISGFNLKGFTERWASGEFFALADVADGSLPVSGLNFKATIKGGVARVDVADAALERRVISIDGIIAYFGRALALSGYLAPLAGDGAKGNPEASFFIGGPWDAPFVSPIAVTRDDE